MQPILTADSFRRNSRHFKFQFVYAGYSDAVKTADLIVLQTLRYAPGLQNGGAGFVQRSAEGCRTSRMKLTKNLQVIRRPHYVVDAIFIFRGKFEIKHSNSCGCYLVLIHQLLVKQGRR